jgi:hypothetical protein
VACDGDDDRPEHGDDQESTLVEQIVGVPEDRGDAGQQEECGDAQEVQAVPCALGQGVSDGATA